MPAVLVTGAAGFIGTALCRRLRELKYEVIAVDKVLGGKECLGVDLLKREAAGDELKKIRPDFIVHLAAIAHGQKPPPGHSVISANVEILKCVLETFEDLNPVFIMASSVAVYGEAVRKRLINFESVLRPSSDYGKSKVICEQALFLSELSDFMILRLAPVFSQSRLTDVRKRTFLPGLGSVRMWMIPAPEYNFCSLSTAVRAFEDKINSGRQGRKIGLVMDERPLSQHDIFRWFKGPALPVPVSMARLLISACRLLPKWVGGYRIQCDLEKLFFTHLFVDGNRKAQ